MNAGDRHEREAPDAGRSGPVEPETAELEGAPTWVEPEAIGARDPEAAGEIIVPPRPPLPATGPTAALLPPASAAPAGAPVATAPTAAPQYVWAPPPPPSRRRRGSRVARRIRIGLIVLVVALILAGLLVLNAVRQAAEARAAAAAAAVQSYLEAIEAGDAAQALSHVDNAPDQGGFLTDDVLASSAALGPISHISAAALGVVGSNGQVSAHYRVGDIDVDGTFDVVDFDDDGVYELASVSQLNIGDRFRGLDVTLNGVPLPTGITSIFPGAYQLATAQPYFTLGEKTFTVADGYSEAADIQPALSEAGIAAYHAALDAAVNLCIAAHTLVAGCGLDLPPVLSDGTVLYDGTVFRSLSAEARAALGTAVPTLDAANPSVATVGELGAVAASADCTQNGVDGQCDVVHAPALRNAAVIMTEDPLVAQWR